MFFDDVALLYSNTKSTRNATVPSPSFSKRKHGILLEVAELTRNCDSGIYASSYSM
jgi:hypothetical protein